MASTSRSTPALLRSIRPWTVSQLSSFRTHRTPVPTVLGASIFHCSSAPHFVTLPRAPQLATYPSGTQSQSSFQAPRTSIAVGGLDALHGFCG